MKLRKKKGDETGEATSTVTLADEASEASDGSGAADSPGGTGMVTTQLPAQQDLQPQAEPERAPARAEAAQQQPAQRRESSGGGGGRGPAGFFRQVWGDSALAMSERDRQAAAEFEAAIRPAKEMLVAAVPGAETPEEAAAALEPKGEHVPDPNPEIPSDWFYKGDAVTYYQIRRHIGKPKAMRRNMGNWGPPPGLAGPDQIQLPPGAYGR